MSAKGGKRTLGVRLQHVPPFLQTGRPQTFQFNELAHSLPGLLDRDWLRFRVIANHHDTAEPEAAHTGNWNCKPLVVRSDFGRRQDFGFEHSSLETKKLKIVQRCGVMFRHQVQRWFDSLRREDVLNSQSRQIAPFADGPCEPLDGERTLPVLPLQRYGFKLDGNVPDEVPRNSGAWVLKNMGVDLAARRLQWRFRHSRLEEITDHEVPPGQSARDASLMHTPPQGVGPCRHGLLCSVRNGSIAVAAGSPADSLPYGQSPLLDAGLLPVTMRAPTARLKGRRHGFARPAQG